MTSTTTSRPSQAQSGVTLLLTVFIVSGIALIAAVVSVLAIQGIRNSRAILLSEPALGSAQSGAEEGVWAIKRAATLPLCDQNGADKNSITYGNVFSARTYCKTYDGATFTIKANQPYTFYLYDPDSPNDDIDLKNMAAGEYTCMVADLLSGSHTVNVAVTRFDGTFAGSPSSSSISSSTSKTSSTCDGQLHQRTVTNLQGLSNNDNRMIVTLTYCPSGCTDSDSATVSVNTNVGIPTVPTVDSTGCAQRGAGSGSDCNAAEIFSRRVQVTVPGESNGIAASNIPPTVSITSPANGATFNPGDNIAIAAAASDSDGTVSKVEFYVDSNLISTDTTSPYNATWSNATSGNHTLTAVATDNSGGVTSSAPISITVGSSPISRGLTSGVSWGSTKTWTQNTSASDNLMLVFVRDDSGNVTSVTNSNGAMTQMPGSPLSIAGFKYYAYYYKNPTPSLAHTITVATSSAAIAAVSVTYANVNVGAFPKANTTTSGVSGDISANLNLTANSYSVLFAADRSGAVPTPKTNTVAVANVGAAASMALLDSNGPVAGGSYTQAATNVNDNSIGEGGFMIEIPN